MISSNFTIDDVVPEDLKGRSENVRALYRRFWMVNIRDFLPLLGLKMLSKYEINQLKKDGNLDPRKLFLSWDYTRNIPTGEPIPSAEDLQELVRSSFYK